MALVFITRALEDARATARKVEARGYQTLIEPLLRIHPLEWVEPGWSGIPAVIITSHNALQGFDGHAVPRDRMFFVVGARTASGLRARGYIHVTGTVEKSEDLPYPLRLQIRPEEGTLLHLTSPHAHDDFYQALRDEGYPIAARHVYRAEESDQISAAAAEMLAEGRVDAALFYSARTVRIFEGLTHRQNAAAGLKKTRALCLSPAVAAACNEKLWKSVEAAHKPTQDSLMDCLAKAVPINP